MCCRIFGGGFFWGGVILALGLLFGGAEIGGLRFWFCFWIRFPSVLLCIAGKPGS